MKISSFLVIALVLSPAAFVSTSFGGESWAVYAYIEGAGAYQNNEVVYSDSARD